MTRAQLEAMLCRVRSKSPRAANPTRDVSTPKAAAAPAPPAPGLVPIGIPGVLAATEKLLAINRGLTDPDERDD